MKNKIRKTINFISFRFLFSKKSQNLVNVISIISTISIMLITMALVIIISIFNGFQHIITKQYSSFYPDISITSTKSVFFNPQKLDLKNTKFIKSYSHVIETKALLKNDNGEHFVTILGVDSNFTSQFLETDICIT